MRDYGLTQGRSRSVVKSRPAVAMRFVCFNYHGEDPDRQSWGGSPATLRAAVLAVAERDKRVEAAKQMAGMTVRQAEALAKRAE
ncbi:MAG: hypothetical protein ACLR4Z_17050 [Butyricicoccaceae bacterium]